MLSKPNPSQDKDLNEPEAYDKLLYLLLRCFSLKTCQKQYTKHGFNILLFFAITK